MSKELEALERIKYKLSSTKANGYWEDLDIIETALKRLEDHEGVWQNTNLKQIFISIEDWNIERKKLKALEIIKNNLCGKLVFRWLRLGNFGVVEIHREDGFIMTLLIIETQEEFDLLKEVLL